MKIIISTGKMKLSVICITVVMISQLINPGFSTNEELKSSIRVNEHDQGDPEILWNLTFGGTGSDNLWSSTQTTEGGFALAGMNRTDGDVDIWLVVTCADGTEKWNCTVRKTGNETYPSIVQTIDGGFIITCSTDSSGYADLWLVKVTNDGTVDWNRTIGGSDLERPYSLILTADGGIAIAGETSTIGPGYHPPDFWLMKATADGIVEWEHAYGGSKRDIAYSLIQTADGGFIIAGSSGPDGQDSSDGWLVKTDAAGKEEWNHSYPGIDRDIFYSIIQTIDGGYAIAGETGQYGEIDNNAWIIKTTVNGILEWQRTYKSCVAYSIILTADGGFALAGIKSRPLDVWLLKATADGIKQWSRSYGGTGLEWGYSLIQTDDGGFVIAGTTQSYGAGKSDFWLLRTTAIEFTPTSTSHATSETTITTTLTSNSNTISTRKIEGLKALIMIITLLSLQTWHKRKKRP